MSDKQNRFIINNVRFNYATVFEPKSFNGKGKPRYSVMLLIPKDEVEAYETVNSEIQKAFERGNSQLGDNFDNIRVPLRDGDKEHPTNPVYKGMMFMNASTYYKPGLFNADGSTANDSKDLYSGCYGNAQVEFIPYNFKGNKGLSCRLYNLQTTVKGKRLG